MKNHALGGTSSRTCQTKGLWKAVLDELKKGDTNQAGAKLNAETVVNGIKELKNCEMKAYLKD